MRTLVCVIGQPREEDLVWDNFKKFILKGEADLCLCIDKSDNAGIMKKNAKYLFEYDETHGDITDGFELMKEFENGSDNWKELEKIPNNWIQPLGDISKCTGGLLLFYRWFLWKNLREHDLLDKYDRFVVTRSDYMHTHELPVDNESILIPAFEFHGGVTDRLSVIPKKFIEEFLRIGVLIVKHPDKLWEIYKNGSWPLRVFKRGGEWWGWNLETYIFIALKLTGQWGRIKFFGPTMFTVMSKKNPKYSSIFNETHQCYLRYATEYNNLTKTPGSIFDSTDIDFAYMENDMFVGRLHPSP